MKHLSVALFSLLFMSLFADSAFAQFHNLPRFYRTAPDAEPHPDDNTDDNPDDNTDDDPDDQTCESDSDIVDDVQGWVNMCFNVWRIYRAIDQANDNDDNHRHNGFTMGLVDTMKVDCYSADPAHPLIIFLVSRGLNPTYFFNNGISYKIIQAASAADATSSMTPIGTEIPMGPVQLTSSETESAIFQDILRSMRDSCL